MDIIETVLPPPDMAALFLDVDGTLIDIAARPEDVIVPADLAPSLCAAAARAGGALAVLSGRTIAELDRLLSPARLPASGIHGAEFRTGPDASTERADALPAGLAARLRDVAAAFPGTLFEDKGPTVAVHFRASPEREAALRVALSACLKTGGHNLELMTGDMVFEIKPPGFDKGGALRRFMAGAPFAGRVPIFISDHPIDAAGFAASVALGGHGLSVGARLPGTSGCFSGPTQVRAWLREFAA